MENNAVHGQIQEALQTAQLAKVFGQGLLDMLKRRHNSQSNEPVDNQKMLRDLLVQNAQDTVASLELTTEAAFHILGAGFESENILDPTWQKRWITGVTNVSAHDEERRSWWARLLAGEIQKPGSSSLRTLGIMDNLSPTEAQIFTRLCSCVWRTDLGNLIVMTPNAHEGRIWGIATREIDVLAETGLVSRLGLGYQFKFIKDISHPFSYGDLDVLVVPNEDKSLSTSPMELTTAGREVLNLVEIVPDQAYLRQMLIKLKEVGKVHHAVRMQFGWGYGDEILIAPDENSLG